MIFPCLNCIVPDCKMPYFQEFGGDWMVNHLRQLHDMIHLGIIKKAGEGVVDFSREQP